MAHSDHLLSQAQGQAQQKYHYNYAQVKDANSGRSFLSIFLLAKKNTILHFYQELSSFIGLSYYSVKETLISHLDISKKKKKMIPHRPKRLFFFFKSEIRNIFV